MENKNILLTAFQGTSAELLIQGAKGCATLLLPNDKIKDSEKLIDAISSEKFDYVISFGQRPNIKDKVNIETIAREHESCIYTNFDCDKLKEMFERKGIIAKISTNAGTSFCNQLYWNGLKYIFDNNLKTRMVFVHIPFVKNIADFDRFRKQIFEAIAEM